LALADRRLFYLRPIMKLNIYRYIFREIWPTFLAVLFVFIFIMLATRMVKISEWVINQGVPPLQVMKMILFLSPNILHFSLKAAACRMSEVSLRKEKCKMST